MDAGTIGAEYRPNPAIGLLYTHYMTNAGWDLNGGTAAFSAWSCAEGTFGGTVGASLCANVQAGPNTVIDTILDYSTIPGTRSNLVDDVVVGDMQQGADYDAALNSWAGGQLIIQSSTWSEFGTTDAPAGYQLTFAQVPLPASAWLFGSAISLLGWLRRRKTN